MINPIKKAQMVLMLLMSASAAAQTVTPDPIATDEPSLFGKIVQVAGERISKINIAAHFANFDAKDPLAGRRLAVFNAEGALVYDRDWRGRDDDFQHSDAWVEGRDTGWTFVRYQLHFAQSGQKLISFSAMDFKDLLRRADASEFTGDGHDDSHYPVNDVVAYVPIQNGSLFTFAWDENFSYSNIKSFTMTPVAIELGFPLTAKHPSGHTYTERFPKQIFAITAGSSLNWMQMQMDGDGGHISGYNAGYTKSLQFQQHFTAGARYIYDGKKGWTIDTSFQFQYRLMYGNYVKRMPDESIPDDNGVVEKFSWESWYWNPSVSVSRRSIMSRKPRQVGMTLEGNIPNYDVFRGSVSGKRSMIQYNNQIVKAGVWVKF